MNPVVRLGVMLLGMCGGASAWAASYPTADQLRAAIVEISTQLKPEKMEVQLRDARKEGIALALMAAGLNLDDGVCVVYYNDAPEGVLTPFFESVPARDLPIWLNAIAMHEVTHCIEQREAYIRRRFDLVLPPGAATDKLTVQGYYSVVKSGAVETWGEALGDIVSVLYFRQAVPDRWVQFADGLVGLRGRLANQSPEHNTSAWLRKIISAGIDKPANQSLFEAAFQLRRQHRPE